MSADLEEYVAARWQRLVRFAVLVGARPDEAEDVVQSALLSCARSWDRVSRADDLDAYVHRVVLNALRRQRRRVPEIVVERIPESAVPDPTESVARRHAVAAALRVLTYDQRACVALRFYAGLTERQMSAVLGVPPGTVKSRLSRALDVLSGLPELAEL